MLAPMSRRLAAALALAAALTAGGCGRVGEDRPNAAATLVLAGPASAVDAGIDLAVARDFDGAEGVTLRVRRPAARGDGLRRLLDGRAEFAVLDIHDLARARADGRDVVGVMAIVQRPLAAVLADPGAGRPRDLAGLRVAVSGRNDAAILAAVVREDGGTVHRVRTVRVRAPLSALLSSRVSHVSGAGYQEALKDPESAVGAVVDRTPSLDRAAVQAGFDAVSPAFVEGVSRFGDLDLARLQTWARWEALARIVRRRPDVARAFAPGF